MLIEAAAIALATAIVVILTHGCSVRAG
jgi:hypothetical protein